MKVYPSAYTAACSTIALTFTPIDDVILNVFHAAGTPASDITFDVNNAAVAGCTDGITYTI